VVSFTQKIDKISMTVYFAESADTIYKSGSGNTECFRWWIVYSRVGYQRPEYLECYAEIFSRGLPNPLTCWETAWKVRTVLKRLKSLKTRPIKIARTWN